MRHICRYCGKGCYCKCGSPCGYPIDKGMCRKCRLTDDGAEMEIDFATM